MSRVIETKSGYLCFHRLAIMGLTERGMQPFELDTENAAICNGELYCFPSHERGIKQKIYLQEQL